MRFDETLEAYYEVINEGKGSSKVGKRISRILKARKGVPAIVKKIKAKLRGADKSDIKQVAKKEITGRGIKDAIVDYFEDFAETQEELVDHDPDPDIKKWASDIRKAISKVKNGSFLNYNEISTLVDTLTYILEVDQLLYVDSKFKKIANFLADFVESQNELGNADGTEDWLEKWATDTRKAARSLKAGATTLPPDEEEALESAFDYFLSLEPEVRDIYMKDI